MVAEDEEGCLDEYISKGLKARSANFKCQSPFHNNESQSVLSTTITHDGVLKKNDIVIEKGIIVQILATRCNGVSECWNSEDEANCSFSIFITFSIGK